MTINNDTLLTAESCDEEADNILSNLLISNALGGVGEAIE